MTPEATPSGETFVTWLREQARTARWAWAGPPSPRRDQRIGRAVHRVHREPCVLLEPDQADAVADLAEHVTWLLEHAYPADVFTGESGDLGAVNVARIRQALARLRPGPASDRRT